jgi:hypothetical protein
METEPMTLEELEFLIEHLGFPEPLGEARRRARHSYPGDPAAMTADAATNGGAIDFDDLWRKCPRWSRNQKLLVIAKLDERAHATLHQFAVDWFTARNNILSRRRPPQFDPDRLTADEWARLFGMLGADESQVRHALWELGFGWR